MLAAPRAEASPRLSVVGADSKYRNDALDEWLRGQDRLRVEVTSRPEGQKGFHPLPKRWVVEPTFAGLIRSRRPVRDFERLPGTSAAMVKLSSIHRMARRARPPRGRRVHVHDLHATFLQLLGLDHTRLTFRHAGRDFRLTGVHGELVKPVLGRRPYRGRVTTSPAQSRMNADARGAW